MQATLNGVVRGAAPPVAEKRTSTRRLVKGNEAIALGAVAGGLDCFFGYPITPQNEIPEILSDVLPRLGRVFLQAESEVASINMVYGAAAAGHRAMTTSSGPGISLMMEGLSYIAGARLPCLIVNIMRGGPGLGNIAPSQGDYFQACKGGGHGDYHNIVLAPWNVQEMFDFPSLAFDLSERYRVPGFILADAVLGAMLEPAVVPSEFPPVPRAERPWATTGRGTRDHKNVVNSLWLDPNELCAHCEELQAAYLEARREVRFDARQVDDAEIVVIAYGISARLAYSAVRVLRQRGKRVGLLRPITLYPFPTEAIAELATRVKSLLVVELSSGQMLEDVRLAVEGRCPVHFFGRMGGVLPSPEELEDVLQGYLQGGR
ncbi:MAG: 3-methyl-2-oxobutanoate dehydrogenase subunit VorB [Planctomycetota bacterium]